MRLLAISDLHLGHPVNRDCFPSIGPSREDWLIVAGDIAESEKHIATAFEYLVQHFARVIWVPGNHELWTTNRAPEATRGVARDQALVAPGAGVWRRHPGVPLRALAREQPASLHRANVSTVRLHVPTGRYCGGSSVGMG